MAQTTITAQISEEMLSTVRDSRTGNQTDGQAIQDAIRETLPDVDVVYDDATREVTITADAQKTIEDLISLGLDPNGPMPMLRG